MSRLVATGLAIPGRLEQSSLTLEAGTLNCLIGPNGSGKTSLLHAIAGIGSASGEVRVDGVVTETPADLLDWDDLLDHHFHMRISPH